MKTATADKIVMSSGAKGRSLYVRCSDLARMIGAESGDYVRVSMTLIDTDRATLPGDITEPAQDLQE